MLQSQAPLAKPLLSPPPWGSKVNVSPWTESIRGTVHTVLTQRATHAAYVERRGVHEGDDSSARKNTQTDTGKGATRGGGGDTNRTEVSLTSGCVVCTGKAGWCALSWPSLSG